MELSMDFCFHFHVRQQSHDSSCKRHKDVHLTIMKCFYILWTEITLAFLAGETFHALFLKFCTICNLWQQTRLLIWHATHKYKATVDLAQIFFPVKFCLESSTRFVVADSFCIVIIPYISGIICCLYSTSTCTVICSSGIFGHKSVVTWKFIKVVHKNHLAWQSLFFLAHCN